MDLLWTHYGLTMDSYITNLHSGPTRPKIIQVIIHIEIALQKIQGLNNIGNALRLLGYKQK